MVRLKLLKPLNHSDVIEKSQFHYGSIKTEVWSAEVTDFKLVSIPLWFD